VLFEADNKEGYIYGFTENYIKVKALWNPNLVNTLQAVKLIEIAEDGIVTIQFLENASDTDISIKKALGL